MIEFEGVRVKLTPMIEQFLAAKRAHPDAVLFFRMGDFYELFFEDARLAHRELGLTLTSRNKGGSGEDDGGGGDELPMAGVPVRAMEEYLFTLVERGYRVAICDQLQDPSVAQGIVERGITRVVTPGTLVDERPGAARSARILAAVAVQEAKGRVGEVFGLGFVDIATGSFSATEVVGMASLAGELQRIGVRELLVDETHRALVAPIVSRLSRISLQAVPSEFFDARAVLRHIGEGPRAVGDLDPGATFLGPERIESFFEAVRAFEFREPAAPEAAVAAIVRYVAEMQRGIAGHIQEVRPYRVDAFMVIDEATQANLELTETVRGGKREGSLVGVLDETVTAAGGRRLRTWLTYPLLDARRIRARHDAIEELVERFGLRERVRTLLDETHDIERLTGRLATGRATPRHLVQLRRTLETIPALREALAEAQAPQLKALYGQLDPCEDLRDLIASAIVDEPPIAIQDGGVIREGWNAEFDRVVELARSGKQWLLDYETTQKRETGIPSLKIKYQRVFGYFIEVTRANLHLVPEHYIRRQTLTNCERYYTDELKEYEEEVLTAEEKRHSLELELFESVRAQVAQHLGRLRHTASSLATLDVLAALAHVAHERGYCRPTIREDDILLIDAGRHPVVERFLDGERFVPNDLEMNGTDARLQIITGPNMAGKSTVIRQAALIVLLAQAGSFVPARRAEIGLVDRIFSRVGASDNLALGQSTFMVEMTETANILRHATKRSLVILDEIGRGTSTYDGLSIAWAVAEYLHDTIGARVLFATHYHELTELARTLSGVVNLSVAVKEWQQQIIFLRKLVKGAANRSYGIQVARLAGLPAATLERAEEILHNLEMNSTDEHGRPTFARHLQAGDTQLAPSESTAPRADEAPQFDLFGRKAGVAQAAAAASSARQAAAAQAAQVNDERQRKLDSILEELDATTLDATTPIQALNLLFKWQRRLKNR